MTRFFPDDFGGFAGAGATAASSSERRHALAKLLWRKE
jgi:hypothetical protein